MAQSAAKKKNKIRKEESFTQRNRYSQLFYSDVANTEISLTRAEIFS